LGDPARCLLAKAGFNLKQPGASILDAAGRASFPVNMLAGAPFHSFLGHVHTLAFQLLDESQLASILNQSDLGKRAYAGQRLVNLLDLPTGQELQGPV
jgi:hypothetical protein